MNLTNEQKESIVAATHEYMTSKRLRNTEISRRSGVNDSYLSQMLRGVFVMPTGGKETAISDKWFRQVATAIDYKIEKAYLKTLLTPELMTITSRLTEAKETGENGMLIGVSGCGKTTSIAKFANKNPRHTYVITINNLCTLQYMLDVMLEKFGINEKGRRANKLDRIADHMRNLKHAGEDVIIILDEAENMELPLVKTVKALYDKIVSYCSIVLVGTPQLIDKLDKWKAKDANGVAQFCRRFKANTYYLPVLDTSYTQFFKEWGIEGESFQMLLMSLCENYGELNDYLVKVYRVADERGLPVNEDLFRLVHNKPKPVKGIR